MKIGFEKKTLNYVLHEKAPFYTHLLASLCNLKKSWSNKRELDKIRFQRLKHGSIT